MSTDLHTALRAVIEQRLEVARAACDGGPGVWSLPRVTLTHIEANKPERIIRECKCQLRMLERHAPVVPGHIGGLVCKHSWADSDGWIDSYPCDDILDLLDVYPEVTQ